MKKLFTLLFFTGMSSMLYPLTTNDWRVIYALRHGSMTTGAATGGFLGYKIGTAIRKYDAKRAHEEAEHRLAPPPGIIEHANARQARELPKRQLRENIKRKLRRKRIENRTDPVILVPTAFIAGSKLGYLGGAMARYTIYCLEIWSELCYRSKSYRRES